MITRRCLLATSAALLTAPLTAEAKQPGKTPRVGYVTSTTRTANVDVFEQGLRELGYAIGQNVLVEYRFGEGRVDRIPVFVAELLRLKVDVLFGANPYAIRAMLQATTTVPIVGVDLETDPLQAGWSKAWRNPEGT